VDIVDFMVKEGVHNFETVKRILDEDQDDDRHWNSLEWRNAHKTFGLEETAEAYFKGQGNAKWAADEYEKVKFPLTTLEELLNFMHDYRVGDEKIFLACDQSACG